MHGAYLGSSVYNRYSDEETRRTRLDLRSRPEVYTTMECGSRSMSYDRLSMKLWDGLDGKFLGIVRKDFGDWLRAKERAR